MNGEGVLEIEVVQRSSRAHAGDRTLPHEQIKRRQPADEVLLRSGIYASPQANQTAVPNLNIQLLTCHDRQQLCGCGESTNLFY
jgi:hypothetical protein